MEAAEEGADQNLSTDLHRCEPLGWRRQVEEVAAPCTGVGVLLQDRLPVVQNGGVCACQA